jgi:hypothetical protein
MELIAPAAVAAAARDLALAPPPRPLAVETATLA